MQYTSREEAKGRRLGVSLRTLDSTAGRSLFVGEVGDGENGDSQGLGGAHWHAAGERGRGHSWNTPPSTPYRVRTSIIYGVPRSQHIEGWPGAMRRQSTGDKTLAVKNEEKGPLKPREVAN